MPKWGKVNYKQLQQLQKRMEKLEKVEFERFCEEVAKELAARLIAKVVKRTPVGDYDDGTVGGTLRRGWTSKSHREAELASTFGGGSGAKKFSDSMVVKKVGNNYVIEVINPVEYAAYVEFGHRTRNHKGWVPGQFMMTISADELQRQAPRVIEKKLVKLLGDAFSGD